MANIDCEACSDLRETAPQLVVNGFDSSMCTSLKNNTGLVASSGHDSCTDLNDLNDCLVGNMKNEVKAYDVCDWKKFMVKFIPNVWTTLKGIICTLCGLWSSISTALCYVGFVLNGKAIRFTEDDFEKGTGVTFSGVSDISLIIKGTTYRFNGSAAFSMSTGRWSELGLANSGAQISDHRLNTTDGNWTIALLKIKKSDYPWLSTLRSTTGTFMNAGVAQIAVNVYNGDSEDSTSNSYPSQWGNAGGRIRVPEGYLYVRISLIGVTTWGGSQDDTSKQITMNAVGMADIKINEIEC